MTSPLPHTCRHRQDTAEAVLESHGLEPGTEPYTLLLEYDGTLAVRQVTGGRSEVVDLGAVDLTAPPP